MKRKAKGVFLLSLAVAVGATFFVACDDEGSKKEQAQVVKYTVEWLDENGELLSKETVKEGVVPSYTYSVTDTIEWDYTFEGWSEGVDGEILSVIPAVTKDIVYHARVTAMKQRYTVKFNSNGGSAVDTQTVEYGNKATLPETPEYDGHRFVGWSKALGGDELVDFESAITGNVEYFAVWNEMIDVKGLLSTLLNGYQLNPFAYIPESMQANYKPNLVVADSIVNDYSNFVNVSEIRYGFGEQWRMVLDNLEQSQTFFNVLSVVEGLTTTSVTAFNNYFDENPSDIAHHEFKSGIYNVIVDFDGESIIYVLDYTATLPLLGEQTIQIALQMDVETGEKVVRIQLGDANALTYKIRENAYEFAIRYLGVRRAMFAVKRDSDGKVAGYIYEYLTVASVETASCAQFYIDDEYVSAVGNKASGMVGFTGYINELYRTSTGKLLGYEVQETLSAVRYDTLWFTLSDVAGLQSVKYRAVQGETPAVTYINGSNSEWKAKKVGGLGLKMLSRRFDIEFRTQYVYSYDESKNEYTVHEIQVPMLFVQEEFYDDFATDVKETNCVTLNITLSSGDLNRILDDYERLLPVFIQNKDKVTVDLILAFIGNKITFSKEI